VLALTRALQPMADRHEFVLYVLEEDLPLFSFARGTMRIVPVSERFRPPAKNIWWHQTYLTALARTDRLEVLHVPSYRRLLWPRPCALVATIHDLAPFRVRNKYSLVRMVYGRVAARQLAHRQHEIVAVSSETQKDIRRFFHVPAERITVIYNGIDHSRFTPVDRSKAAAQIAQAHGVHPPFFLYVSRLEHPAKNHARLIDAFNRFKTISPSPWRLVLSGSDWHGSEVIHQLVKRSPFAQDIHCPGFVADADLPTWYRAATVFVYPSLFEGFGLPPLEAMACGCPVLASQGGAVGEVCGDAAAFVDPMNVNDLTRKMAELAGDAALRSTLHLAGLARARAFDWNRAAAATLKVYERAAARLKAPLLTSPFATPAT
jgi:glycosyltransferase involved in cell wall biosynthesis